MPSRDRLLWVLAAAVVGFALSGTVRAAPGPVPKHATGSVPLAFSAGSVLASSSILGLLGDLAQPGAWHEYAIGRQQTVVVARDGTVWASDGHGLRWYDGYRWAPVDTTTLSGDAFELVAPAPGSGLLVLDRQRLYRIGRRRTVRLVAASEAPWRISSAVAWRNQIVLLQLRDDPDGLRRRLVTFDGQQLEPWSGPALPAPALPLPGLWATRSGALWVNTEDGLFVLRDDVWERALPVTGRALRVALVVEGPSGDGFAFVDGYLPGSGLWSWHAGSRAYRLGHPGNVVALAVLRGGIGIAVLDSGRAIAVDHAGSLHFAELGVRLRGVRTMAVDRRDDLWIASEDGLRRFGRHDALWQRAGLSENRRVHEILPRPDGSVWLATDDGLRIVRPDGSTQRIQQIGGQQLHSVTGLAQDRDGDVWISSGSSFTGAWRLHEGRWDRIGPKDGLAPGYYHRVILDRRGELWLLGLRREPVGRNDTAGIGAHRLTENGFERWDRTTGLPSGQVYDVERAPDGALWFGTIRGLARFRDGTWRVWTRADGLATDRIFDLAIDASGVVYFVHQRDGVGVIRPGHGVQYLNRQLPLPLSRVWRLLPAFDSSLWIAGEGGIARVHDGAVTELGLGSGLPAADAWALALAGDRLYVGTLGGGAVWTRIGDTHSAAPPRIEIGRPDLSDEVVFVSWRVRTYRDVPAADSVQTRYRIDTGPWSPWSLQRAVHARPPGPGAHNVEVQARLPLQDMVVARAARSFLVTGSFWRNPRVRAALAVAILLVVVITTLVARQRRLQQERLRRSEFRLRSLFEKASDVILTHDLSDRVTDANPAACRVSGYTRDELIGMPLSELFSSESLQIAHRMMQAKLSGADSTTYDAELRCKDGSTVPIELSSQLLFRDDEIIGAQAIGRDVRERRRTEEILNNIAMAISAETGTDLLRSLVESLARELHVAYAAVMLLQPDADLAGAGASDPPHRPDGDAPRSVRVAAFWPPDTGSLLGQQIPLRGTPCEQVLASGASIFPDRLLERFPDDETLVALGAESYAAAAIPSTDGRVLGLLLVIDKQPLQRHRIVRSVLRIFATRAAAELEHMRAREQFQQQQQQLQRAQKMEAVGRLAGGIAHDFNNLLTVITGHAALAVDALPADSPVRADLTEVLRAGRSAARLTRELLEFTREQQIDPGPTELNAAIRAAEPLLADLLGPGQELRLQLHSSHLPVPLGRTSLEQVLTNLVVNASHAMEEGGTVLIGTCSTGEAARLTVQDDGTGMTREVARRAFDPFFTTKPRGTGTGLGLATVYGIVQRSGGRIDLVSSPGQGTTLQIDWPVARKRLKLDSRSDREATPADEVAAPDHTVLVVDDQEMVRSLVRRSLEERGYRVITAASGQEALDALDEQTDPVDLLLSDIVMPDLDGIELAERVRVQSPPTQVVLMSGYDAFAHTPRRPDYPFLPKPFTPRELASVVQDLLRRG